MVLRRSVSNRPRPALPSCKRQAAPRNAPLRSSSIVSGDAIVAAPGTVSIHRETVRPGHAMRVRAHHGPIDAVGASRQWG